MPKAAPLLLISATVNPRGMTMLHLHDVKAREAEYLNALDRLLSADPDVDAITLVENSGADLEPFRDLVARRNVHAKSVELIGLDLNDFPRELGKGYGEFRAIDAGLERSELARSRTHLVKLTGRLGVRNLGAVVRSLPPSFDLVADIHPDPGDPARGVVDTRLMALSLDFYRRKVCGLYREMHDGNGVWAEHAFYALVRRNPGAGIVPRLPREPRWVGSSGSTGARYDGLIAEAKYPLKALRRAVKRLRGRPDLRRVWEADT